MNEYDLLARKLNNKTFGNGILIPASEIQEQMDNLRQHLLDIASCHLPQDETVKNVYRPDVERFNPTPLIR